MRVCVGPDASWLNFVGLRPFPLEEDGEDTISKWCPIGAMLTNLLQNYSAEAFQQINDQLEGFSLVRLSDEDYLSWRSSIQVQISCRFHGPVTRSRSLPNCRSHADFPILRSAARSLRQQQSRVERTVCTRSKVSHRAWHTWLSWTLKRLKRAQRQWIARRGLGSAAFQFLLRVEGDQSDLLS